MCADCAREYADPADRRFHAQPVCCPQCGPTLSYVAPGRDTVHREDALRAARTLLARRRRTRRQGHRRLPPCLRRAQRRRGRRVAATEAPRRQAVCGDGARYRQRHGASPRSTSRPNECCAGRSGRSCCCPGWPTPGWPTPSRRATPISGSWWPTRRLHVLLFGLDGDEPGPDVLVMTSGNLGGEPICYDDDDALARLADLADGWLMHDRAILVPCDDSVVRVLDGIELPIRRSRGYAPLPVALPVPLPPTLAVGADLKNTMAVADGRYAWLSQHIGDMDDLATLSAFDSAQAHLRALTGVDPVRAGRRRAPDVPVDRLGAPQRRRTPGPHGAASPRPHRRGDGRTRVRRLGAGDRIRLRRNGLRVRRRGVGWRGPARQLQGIPATGAVEVRAAGGRRRQRPAPVPDGAGAPVGGRHRLGCRPRARRRLPARRAESARQSAGNRPGVRADVEHGPAVRRGVLARRRPAGRRLRGAGRDRVGRHVTRNRLRCSGYVFTVRRRRGSDRPGPGARRLSSRLHAPAYRRVSSGRGSIAQSPI